MPPGFRPRFALLLLAAPLATLTCDDSRRDDPLSERVAAAYCAHQFDCCSPFEITLMSSDRYKTETDCLPFATLAARQQLATVEGAISLGRITVDAARADACLVAYRDQRCGNGAQTAMQPVPVPQMGSPTLNAADLLAACPDMLIGHVPDGRACNLSLECARGSRCVSGTSSIAGGTGTLVSAPGVCARYQREGEPCNLPSDCDPARHSCHTPDYVCGPRPQRGEACTVQVDITGFPVDDCDASQGLFCDQSFSSSCQRYPKDGEPCNPFSFPQCDPDPELALTCNQFTGTCRRPGGEGEACGGLALPPCRADLACRPLQPDGIGTCGAIPTLGERCVDRCASPAICAGTTCVSPGAAAVGAPCTFDAECRSMSCSGFQAGRRVCGVPPYSFAQCLGAGVTAGNVTGAGIGGMSGTGGASGSTGVGARGGPPTGTGGAAGTAGAGGVSGGCPISATAPDDPIIADFDVDVGGAMLLPIGGTFTYGSPAPTAMISNKAWRITLAATGDGMAAKFLGAGIYFNADPSGLACIDASFHTGVQFDISGTIAGTGCTVQYATNDSAHADRTVDPRGSGPPSSWAPQAPLTVTETPTTVMMPFFGTDAPSGGAPPVPVDPSRLTGVLWQFTVALGTANSCVADITIDNVRFF